MHLFRIHVLFNATTRGTCSWENFLQPSLSTTTSQKMQQLKKLNYGITNPGILWDWFMWWLMVLQCLLQTCLRVSACCLRYSHALKEEKDIMLWTEIFQCLKVVRFYCNHCKILILSMCQHVKARFILIVIPCLPICSCSNRMGSLRASG